ncbi:MAG: ParA family partition ATPase [Thauera sp.]|jgi:chromosome partitioning protein|nr:ParA family partition ATPase [Thauera sp.]
MTAPTLIALISQKGGSGKTTLTMQLAAGLSLEGYRVAIADLDPQESALRWAHSAPAEQPFPAEVVALKGKLKTLRDELQELLNRADIVLLDCPPSIEHPHTLAALELCDVALVPVVPSPTDLWASRAMEQLILRYQQQRPQLRGALIPNRVTRTALANEVLDVLQDFQLPVLDAPLSQRNAYALSAVRGGSVLDLGSAADAAQQEVQALTAAVLEFLQS